MTAPAMSAEDNPSRLRIWLGLADDSLARQKTVRFGDASAVNPGRIYSLCILAALMALWIVSSAFGWVKPFYWPTIGGVADRVVRLATEGYRNVALWEHIGISVYRVLSGVFYGAVLGVPLGFAMGLSSVVRGLFDPIVEFMRPVPPLALIPLIILWFGIDETAKIFLLFLASLFIMTIAARAGVSSVSIAKVHAAYSLGASRLQIMRHVILPNALPEIFTGLRTAMGVCWGTVVAAELVAADRGLGSMIMIAKNFLQTDTVVIGIIIIGLIGYGIELLMRWLEKNLIPWKGRG
jgi:taurine transport system permease protein